MPDAEANLLFVVILFPTPEKGLDAESWPLQNPQIVCCVRRYAALHTIRRRRVEFYLQASSVMAASMIG